MHKSRLFVTLGVLASLSACGGGGPAPAQTATALTANSFLGVWCARFIDPTFGAGTSELILKQDGITFQEQYVYRAGSVILISGGFRSFQDPRGTPALRLDTAGGFPNVDQAGSPIHYPAETYCVNIRDNNHVDLTVAAVQCPSGTPADCAVNCNVCNPATQLCTFHHVRGSCDGTVP